MDELGSAHRSHAQCVSILLPGLQEWWWLPATVVPGPVLSEMAMSLGNGVTTPRSEATQQVLARSWLHIQAHTPTLWAPCHSQRLGTDELSASQDVGTALGHRGTSAGRAG